MIRFRNLALFSGAMLAIAVAGCASSASDANGHWSTMVLYPHAQQANLTQSPHEHYQSISHIAESDRRALIEDLDLFFMTERPGRLTRWHSR